MEATCKTCKWKVDLAFNHWAKQLGRVYECKRFPPPPKTYRELGATVAVNSNDYCGEHQYA